MSKHKPTIEQIEITMHTMVEMVVTSGQAKNLQRILDLHLDLYSEADGSSHSYTTIQSAFLNALGSAYNVVRR